MGSRWSSTSARRPSGRSRSAGTSPPVDLDVATRLGSIGAGDIGSTASSLRVAVTDVDGYVVSTPRGWDAVFGFYSPATRPTDMIPGQVRLLKSLLDGREPEVRRIILASDDQRHVHPAVDAPMMGLR